MSLWGEFLAPGEGDGFVVDLLYSAESAIRELSITETERTLAGQ